MKFLKFQKNFTFEGEKRKIRMWYIVYIPSLKRLNSV